jgi:hypothetical protein
VAAQAVPEPISETLAEEYQEGMVVRALYDNNTDGELVSAAILILFARGLSPSCISWSLFVGRVCGSCGSRLPSDPDELSFTAADIMEVESVVSSEWLVCTLFGERGLVRSR